MSTDKKTLLIKQKQYSLTEDALQNKNLDDNDQSFNHALRSICFPTVLNSETKTEEL